jgi:predicted HicB family RNase H-like nuclease
MKKELTAAEIEQRMAAINARPAEVMTPEEEASLAAAEAMDDGSAVPYEAFKQELEECSGKLVIRLPKSLHRALKEAAKREGVSLNQYMIYKLSQ